MLVSDASVPAGWEMAPPTSPRSSQTLMFPVPDWPPTTRTPETPGDHCCPRSLWHARTNTHTPCISPTCDRAFSFKSFQTPRSQRVRPVLTQRAPVLQRHGALGHSLKLKSARSRFLVPLPKLAPFLDQEKKGFFFLSTSSSLLSSLSVRTDLVFLSSCGSTQDTRR